MGYSPTQYMDFHGSGYQRVGTTRELLTVPAGTSAVLVQAAVGNAGQIYAGSSTVTVPVAGTDDTTSGLQLDNGQQATWIPVPDGGLYIIGSAADQDVTYWALK